MTLDKDLKANVGIVQVNKSFIDYIVLQPEVDLSRSINIDACMQKSSFCNSSI